MELFFINVNRILKILHSYDLKRLIFFSSCQEKSDMLLTNLRACVHSIGICINEKLLWPSNSLPLSYTHCILVSLRIINSFFKNFYDGVVVAEYIRQRDRNFFRNFRVGSNPAHYESLLFFKNRIKFCQRFPFWKYFNHLFYTCIFNVHLVLLNK